MQSIRDLVVVLPGITGSVLQKDGRDVWGTSGQAIWGALSSLGDSLTALFLQSDDPDADVAPDGIRPTRLMPDAHVVPGLVKIDGYSGMLKLITNSFAVVRGSLENQRPANLFEFPYDWRRDNRIAARRLKALVDARLPRWRDYYGAPDAKAILLAHSMGGLIGRYYLEVLEGWRDCRALITFGTPFRGSVNALDFLANGYRKAFVDLTPAMRSFPSVYQLLPTYKVVKYGDDWHRAAQVDGIPGVSRPLAEDALCFHEEIRAKVEEHRQDPEYLLNGYKTVPIVGFGQPTWQSATLQNGVISVSKELPSWISDEPLADGDGTVPRASAIPLELSDDWYYDSFVAERHASLQNNQVVLAGLRQRLLQSQVRHLGAIRGPEVAAPAAEVISLDVEDAFLGDEPVLLRVTIARAPGNAGRGASNDPRAARPLVVIRRAFDGQPITIATDFSPVADDWVLRLNGLPAGFYRCEVSAEAMGTVHDFFEVTG